APATGAGPAAPVTAEGVAGYARQVGADYVWTGWVRRLPNWDLEMGIALWKVVGQTATQVGEVVGSDDFRQVQSLTGKALEELCRKVNRPLPAQLAATIRDPVTSDHYAFTLYGRGVAHLLTATGPTAAGELALAERNLRRSVLVDPKHASGQRMLGELLLRKGEAAAARARFSYAAELSPGYYAALAALAEAIYQDGDLPRAREVDEQMVGLRPWDLPRRRHLGRLRWEMGDIDGAYAELSQLIKFEPNDLASRRTLALIHAARGDNQGLVRELEEVVRLAPKDANARLDLAAAYAAVGRVDDATAAYEKLVAENRARGNALKFLGDIHRRAGNRKRAVDYYQRAMTAAPHDPRAYFIAGKILLEDGDIGGARKVFRAALFNLDWDLYLPEIYSGLGAVAWAEGDVQEASAHFRRVVLKRPYNARDRYNYALALSAAGDPQWGLVNCDQGIRFSPRDPDLWYLRGVLLVRLKRPDLARGAFQRTLQLDPGYADAKTNLAKLR
ncbi:MAG TPA: tetratricopeptide repeat protein, partial [Kofleriaceae bacterium]|nr:tetratricopeptide repeat protein [Kofleriaceae bacterium]